MAMPLEKDIQKKQDFKESLMKSIGGEKLSDKKMCSILRSSVRKTWMMSPVRLLKLEQGRIADMDPITRTKWLCRCEHCDHLFKMPEVEVDHKKGEHQLKTLSDVEQFARSILDVTLDDLQIFCKECHLTKTYAERHNMSMNDAKIERKVIDWMKKTPTAKQRAFLSSKGVSDKCISNGVKRRDSYRHILSME